MAWEKSLADYQAPPIARHVAIVSTPLETADLKLELDPVGMLGGRPLALNPADA